MAEANGFVVWADTIKQAPAERTQPAGVFADGYSNATKSASVRLSSTGRATRAMTSTRGSEFEPSQSGVGSR